MTVKFDMTNEEYHLDPALSASGTKTIAMHDLATFKYAERKESTAFDVGTATHTFVLQPELSGEVWCGPETRRGLEWRGAFEARFDFRLRRKAVDPIPRRRGGANRVDSIARVDRRRRRSRDRSLTS